MRGIVVAVLLFVSSGWAIAHSHEEDEGRSRDFVGTWQNVQVRDTQVVRIVITRDYTRDGFCIEVYGLLHGVPHSFGPATGRLFVSRDQRERDQDNSAILVKINRPDWVRGAVLVRFNGRGEIVTHALLHFDDDRGDVYSVDRFAPAGNDYSQGDYPERRRRYYR